jgi:hypothetical protein
MKERVHILETLRKVEKALEKKNYLKIKSLSNHIIHHSSIHQEPDIISLAVILYSLSKLLEREAYKEYKSWPEFYNNYITHLKKAVNGLEIDNIKVFRNEIDLIRKLIQKLSGDLKFHIDTVFRRAKINKASRIYEHGISMEKTAKILGISQWELAEYVGKTGIANVNLGVTMPLKKRIKIAEEIFE